MESRRGRTTIFEAVGDDRALEQELEEAREQVPIRLLRAFSRMPRARKDGQTS